MEKQSIPKEVEEKVAELVQVVELDNGIILGEDVLPHIRQTLLSVYNSGREGKEVVERVAKAIYDQMSYYEDGAKPAWVEGGNSLKQDEARRLAITALSAPSSEDNA